MSRVKSNSNNSIQVDRVISAKRKVEITLDELRDFLNDNIDKEGVTIGSEGEYIWDDKKENILESKEYYITIICPNCKGIG